jgi:hypothetical protein
VTTTSSPFFKAESPLRVPLELEYVVDDETSTVFVAPVRVVIVNEFVPIVLIAPTGPPPKPRPTPPRPPKANPATRVAVIAELEVTVP